MIIKPANRLKQVGEYYFSKKIEEIRQMRLAGNDVINLGIGSPDLSPSDETIAATITALHEAKNHGYSPHRSSPDLRNAMADFYRSRYAVTVDPVKEILPLLGSKEGVFYLSMAYLDPGDTVLVPNPGYPAYSSAALLSGAKIHYYDLTEENHWLPDLKALERSCDLKNCKLMWINYPHMPTGKRADFEVFRKLIEFGKRHQILICNDNPYGLVLNQEAPISFLSPECGDPEMKISAELNSLSKSFNMAGWRVGMLVAASSVIDTVLQVKSNVDSGMFAPVQVGATAALKNSDQWHQERNTIYRERREIVWKIFDLLGFRYDREQVGLLVWAKAPESIRDVSEYCDRVLEKAHVFITPGLVFGSNGARYARSSLCAPVEVLASAQTRISNSLPEIHK